MNIQKKKKELWHEIIKITTVYRREILNSEKKINYLEPEDVKNKQYTFKRK